jgi:hypothetical protein
MFIKKKTTAYKNTYQKNTSALRKYIRHGLTQTKAAITTLKTNTNNI